MEDEEPNNCLYFVYYNENLYLNTKQTKNIYKN